MPCILRFRLPALLRGLWVAHCLPASKSASPSPATAVLILSAQIVLHTFRSKVLYFLVFGNPGIVNSRPQDLEVASPFHRCCLCQFLQERDQGHWGRTRHHVGGVGVLNGTWCDERIRRHVACEIHLQFVASGHSVSRAGRHDAGVRSGGP